MTHSATAGHAGRYPRFGRPGYMVRGEMKCHAGNAGAATIQPGSLTAQATSDSGSTRYSPVNRFLCTAKGAQVATSRTEPRLTAGMSGLSDAVATRQALDRSARRSEAVVPLDMELVYPRRRGDAIEGAEVAVAVVASPTTMTDLNDHSSPW